MTVQGKYADGANLAKALDPTSGNILDPGLASGKVRVLQDTATITASTTLYSSGYFQVGKKLPTGAQVVSVILGIPASLGKGSAAYLMVGDEGDADRYITEVQSCSAQVVVGPNASTGVNYVVTGTTDNIIRVTNGPERGADDACINSSGAIQVSILYVVE